VVSFIEVPAGNLMPTDRKDTPNSPPTSLPGALGDSRSVQPLIGVAVTDLDQNMVIEVPRAGQVYVATSPLVANGLVAVWKTAPVNPGQTATLDDANGAPALTVTEGGDSTGVTLVNRSATTYTMGLAGRGWPSDEFAPIFGATLHGHTEDFVAPLAQILLTFSTNGSVRGTLVEHSMSKSLLVNQDLLWGEGDDYTVSYDIQRGWTTPSTPVKAGDDLTAVLVHQKPLERH